MANILIIDDEKLSLFTLRKIIEQAGHTVIEADNGIKGVEIARSRKIDLVITDIIMPDKDGIETITDIKRHDPHVPVLAMSGGGRTQNLDFLKLAEQRGADRIIAKPFKPSELLQLVTSLLNLTAAI